jgi:hypothetical protein
MKEFVTWVMADAARKKEGGVQASSVSCWSITPAIRADPRHGRASHLALVADVRAKDGLSGVGVIALATTNAC